MVVLSSARQMLGPYHEVILSCHSTLLGQCEVHDVGSCPTLSRTGCL